jgi:hypothetical protein
MNLAGAIAWRICEIIATNCRSSCALMFPRVQTGKITMQMLDLFGVPEFWADRIGAIEDAGFGMMRVVRCIERNGVLVPVFSCVTPALGVLQDNARFREIAQQIVRKEMSAAH